MLKRVTLAIGSAAKPSEVFFESNCAELEACDEAVIAASLLSCMKEGSALQACGSVDRRLLSNLPQLQRIYATWMPELSLAGLETLKPADTPSTKAAGRTGAFFSGGVDSFYTLLQNLQEIDDLILIQGFDMDLEKTDLFERTRKAAEEVCGKLGKTLIVIRTDIKDFMLDCAEWSFGHGLCLMTIAHLLRKRFSKIFVPASHTFSQLFPWGSHPLTDPLWSSEHLSIDHDGAEASRYQKVETISRSAVALDHLRVCYLNYDDAYNCCRCEKCIRTMISLKIAGALERARTFPLPLRMTDAFAMNVSAVNTQAFLQENIAAAEARGTDPEILSVLKKMRRERNRVELFLNDIARGIAEPDRILPALKKRFSR